MSPNLMRNGRLTLELLEAISTHGVCQDALDHVHHSSFRATPPTRGVLDASVFLQSASSDQTSFLRSKITRPSLDSIRGSAMRLFTMSTYCDLIDYGLCYETFDHPGTPEVARPRSLHF